MTDKHAYHIDEPVPETPENAPDSGAWKETEIIGTRQPRVDAYERVSGTAIFPHDVSLRASTRWFILNFFGPCRLAFRVRSLHRVF